MWLKHYGVAPSDLLECKRKWDELLCEIAFNNLLVDADQWNRCRLLAAKSAHSGARSEAKPTPILRNLLDAKKLWVAVAFRVEADISCVSTCLCMCGVRMDAKSYRGRLPRHPEINSIIKRFLEKIGLPSILEPTGLDKSDGRRPDGITTFPWKHGKYLIWEAKVVDAFTKTHIIASSIKFCYKNYRKIKKPLISGLGRQQLFPTHRIQNNGLLRSLYCQFC